MAYYLCVKDNNDYKYINILDHYYFQRLTKFKGNYYSLEEIDNFTSHFSDEISLKENLYSNNLLDEKDMFKNISIRRKVNEKLENVNYGICYSKAYKYFDIEYLTATIIRLSNDKDFLNKLLSHYRNSYCNNENISLIRMLMNGYYESGESLTSALTSFVINEIYNKEYDKDSHEYIYTTIKYKSFHDLVMFVYTHDGKQLTKEELQEKEDKEKEELKGFIKKMKGLYNECEEIKPKVKKRIKKDTNIEGQTSFF